MNYRVYSVYDDKTEAYLQPFFMPTRGAAIRAITDALENPEHQFARHIEDYVLYELGSWDDQKGLFNQQETHVLGRLIEFRRTTNGD